MTRLNLALLLVAALSSASAFVPSGQISSVPLAKPASVTKATCPAKPTDSKTALAMRYDYGYGGGYGRGYGSGYGYGGYGGGYGDALSPRQQMRMRERDEYYGGGYGGGYYGRGYGSRGSNGGYGNGFYDNYRGTYGNGVMNRLDVNSPYSRNMMVQRRGYGGYGDDYYGGGYGSRYGRGGGYYPRDRMSRRDIYDGYNSYYGNGYYGGGRRRMYGGVWNQDNDFIDPQPYRRGYGGDMYDRGYGGGYGRRGYGQRSLMASGTMNMNGETRIDQAQRYNREARNYGGRNLYAWD